jgi:hypothetical protein
MREPERGFDAASFVWCGLGALRLHYTAFTGEVTSKRGAGEYGLQVAPERFHPMLRAALTMRAAGEAGDVQPLYMADTAEIIRWVVADVLAGG